MNSRARRISFSLLLCTALLPMPQVSFVVSEAAQVYLSDYGQGVRMETSGDTVRAVTYYPAKKDDNLRCPSSSKPSP